MRVLCVALALTGALLVLAPGSVLEAQTAEEGREQDGEQAREKAIALNEQGIAAFKDGRAEDALTLFKQAAVLDETNATIRRNVARCYGHLAAAAFRERRLDDAARDYKLAADQEPDNPSWPIGRATALMEDRRNRDAIVILEAVVKAHPKLATAHSRLGLACYHVGRVADAIRSWKEALKLDPKDAIARENLPRAEREESVEKELVEDFGAPHFAIKFDGKSNPDTGKLVARLLEEAYEEVGRRLGVYPRGETAVVVYPSRSFRKVTGTWSWVGGVYDGKIRVPAGGLQKRSESELRRVFRHEYTHALVSGLAGKACPVWLHEGLAQSCDGTAMADASRVLGAYRPSLKVLSQSFVKIRNPKIVAKLYAASVCFTAWLANRGGGLIGFERLLRSLGRKVPIEDAFRDAFGANLTTLHEEWTRS